MDVCKPLALGIKGADLATIQAKVLPALYAKVAEVAAEAAMEQAGAGAGDRFRHGGGGGDFGGGEIDAVVLMCGVNDFKYVLKGRTPSVFHRQLREVVDEIRAVTGRAVP